jgi:hypothetical protein
MANGSKIHRSLLSTHVTGIYFLKNSFYIFNVLFWYLSPNRSEHISNILDLHIIAWHKNGGVVLTTNSGRESFAQKILNSTDTDTVIFPIAVIVVQKLMYKPRGLWRRNCFWSGLVCLWSNSDGFMNMNRTDFFKPIHEGHLFSESTVRSMACIQLLYVPCTTSWVEDLFLKVVIYSGRRSC